tara:strand:+ start:1503 stop:2711 length:1209 start_codon:yes stop_codon:yes gene_type:complete
MLNTKKIKKDFPIFSNNHGLIYLDSASTAQKPQVVIDSISSFYSTSNANVHRALYSIGETATESYENVRKKIRNFLDVPDSHEIIFTKGTTESINLVSNAWGRKYLESKHSIVVTEMEHHANLVPWQIIARETKSKLKYIPIDESGNLKINTIENIIDQNTKMIAAVHQSNVFGTINPIDKLIHKAKSIGAISLIDGAQSVPHLKVSIKDIDCDFFVFSGHKIVGPTGVGVLIGRKNILEQMDPFMGGGVMIDEVSMEKSSWNQIPLKFEAGTPNIAQVIGLGIAIDYISSLGLENIYNHEQELLKYCLRRLKEINNIQIYGDYKNSGGIITFNINGIHPHDLAKFLDTDNICIRAGHHCAQPIMNKLGVSSTARVSFYIYNDIEEIDLLIESIKKTVKIFA